MLKAGILGCGAICQRRHAKEIAANKNCKLYGVFDPVTERAELVAGLYGGKVYNSAEELLDDDNIDIVVVCTPNKYHARYTIKALENGKHVLCEKPMAGNLKDAQAMLNAAEKSGKKLMIGQSQRLVPAHRMAREIIRSGKIGRILTFATTFGHRGAEGWSIEGNPSTWFFKKEEAIFGAMGDIGVHKADLIRYILGEEFCEAAAIIATRDKRYESGELIDVDDNAVCVLKTKSGVVGTLAVSWTYYGGEDNSTIIRGDKGALKIFVNPDSPILIEYADKTVERIDAGTIQTNEKQTDSGVMDLFVNHILKDTPVDISGYEGYKALEVIVKCVESAETKNIVKF
ncbi:MAG: Gfo/Idh/MocA family oxidoreductase [Clostridia bacterium]